MPNTNQSDLFDQWLSPVDLAKELQLPIRTLYNWRARSIGPDAVRIGRHLRYSRAAVVRWLDQEVKRQSKAI